VVCRIKSRKQGIVIGIDAPPGVHVVREELLKASPTKELNDGPNCH
jgi:sRNA-binding carbon storage regulator CsrA